MLKDYKLQIEFTDIYNLSAPKYWTCSAIINNANTYIYIYIYKMKFMYCQVCWYL